MKVEVTLPELGESVTEATITRWLVEVGDEVRRDQPLVEISTDKVDTELPSPASGTISEILVEAEKTITVGTVMATIHAEGADEAQSTMPPGSTRVDSLGPAPVPAPVTVPVPGASERRVFATPVARKIAARERLDLGTVVGSGSRGRITRTDVAEALEARSRTAPEQAPPSAPSSRFSVAPYLEDEDVEIEPMSRIRRLTAEHMTYSQTTSAHVTTVFHADFTAVVAARKAARQSFERKHSTKLTFLPFILHALIEVLQKYPRFNASIDGTNIVLKKTIHLGLAVATDRGLIVPVIHEADRISFSRLAGTANDLAQRAREHKLKPDEITRGTFTITNPGVFGSLFGTPIIHQPQVAILCVGTIEKRPIVETTDDGEDALLIRSMAYLALTYDHRLIDGADAEIFMRDVLRSIRTTDWQKLAQD